LDPSGCLQFLESKMKGTELQMDAFEGLFKLAKPVLLTFARTQQQLLGTARGEEDKSVVISVPNSDIRYVFQVFGVGKARQLLLIEFDPKEKKAGSFKTFHMSADVNTVERRAYLTVRTKDDVTSKELNIQQRLLAAGVPNIPRIFSHGGTLGRDLEAAGHIVLEYGGDDLLDLLNIKNLDEKGVMHVGTEIAKALVGMHDLRIAHFDIKIENILTRVDPKDADHPRILLTDFGLSKEISEGGMAGCMGTLATIAPEAIINERIDLSCDIYSLGTVLFTAKWGGYWQAASDNADRASVTVEMKVWANAPSKESEYRKRTQSSEPLTDLDNLIIECLNPNPNQRPTAAALLEKLQSLQARKPEA
jgi:serine/threonine protein kinase